MRASGVLMAVFEEISKVLDHVAVTEALVTVTPSDCS